MQQRKFVLKPKYVVNFNDLCNFVNKTVKLCLKMYYQLLNNKAQNTNY